MNKEESIIAETLWDKIKILTPFKYQNYLSCSPKHPGYDFSGKGEEPCITITADPFYDPHFLVETFNKLSGKPVAVTDYNVYEADALGPGIVLSVPFLQQEGIEKIAIAFNQVAEARREKVLAIMNILGQGLNITFGKEKSIRIDHMLHIGSLEQSFGQIFLKSEGLDEGLRQFFEMGEGELIGHGDKQKPHLTIPLDAFIRKMETTGFSAKKVLLDCETAVWKRFRESPDGIALQKQEHLRKAFMAGGNAPAILFDSKGAATIQAEIPLFATLLETAISIAIGGMEGGKAISLRPQEDITVSAENVHLSVAAVNVIAAHPEQFRTALAQIAAGQGAKRVRG